MNKNKDLTNQEFGRLKVIKRLESDKYGRRWLCECSCENKNKIIVYTSHLNSGSTQSCGCLQKEIASKHLKTINKLKKKYNTYDLSGEYGIGYTFNNEVFYFDLEDYNKIKNICWYINNNGYITNREKRKITYMHRLVMNCPDDMEVDHIYHKRYDNRKEFLRITTHSQNRMNQVLYSNNTSGVTGVSWSNEKEKWLAEITVNNERIKLDYYNNFDDCVEARIQAEAEYFKEYSLNYNQNKNAICLNYISQNNNQEKYIEIPLY